MKPGHFLRRPPPSLAAAIALLGLGACATVAEPPNSQAGGSVTLALGQSGQLGGLRLVPLRVEEDSRCPASVQCIQAGTVRIAVRIDDGTGRRDIALALDRPSRVGPESRLALCAVDPARSDPGTIDRAAYRFRLTLTRDDVEPPCAPG